MQVELGADVRARQFSMNLYRLFYMVFTQTAWQILSVAVFISVATPPGSSSSFLFCSPLLPPLLPFPPPLSFLYRHHLRSRQVLLVLRRERADNLGLAVARRLRRLRLDCLYGIVLSPVK